MMIFHSYVKLPEGRFVWRYGIQNPMIDFPMKKLVNLLGIPHVWTDTHDNGCIFPSYPTIIARSYPHSISLCIIYVYSFHIYIYTYVYIYTYIHVFMIFPTNLWWFPASTRFTPTSVESFFFQRQGALLLALPLYQTNGVTGEPLGPRAKKRKGPQIEMDKHV